MEEDIKELEEYLKFIKQFDNNSDFIPALENLIKRNKELEENYRRLSIEAQATAFDDMNRDTECLLRVLLKQGQIEIDEKGNYLRKDFDWEKNLAQMGLCKKREKTFIFTEEECLDEYTKQLESQLKEYNELKKIFKKYYVVGNETMYDGCIKMQDEIDELKELLEEKTLRVGFENKEDYISKSKVREKIEEIEKEANYRTIDNPTGRIHFHKEPCDYQIEILQELLQEGDK